MDTVNFHKELKQHCLQQADCAKCCMRLYCYTPPCEKTDFMVTEVMAYLNIENNRSEYCDRSDRYTSDRLQQCPCDMDMSSALGYEHR